MKTQNTLLLNEQEVLQCIRENEILEHCLDKFNEIFDQQETLMFSTKIDGSLVSNLEVEIEKSIGSFLNEVTPWASFVGEEGAYDKSSDEASDYTWFLDPIDGTISFCNKLDTFAFTLTLTHQSEAIATVIYFPRLKKTYLAFKDGGATLNGEKISLIGAMHGPKPIFAVSDDYTFEMTQREDVLMNLKKLPYITRTITDIFGYCMVAEGKCIGKFDAAGAIWDLSPGYLLIKESGGKCLFFPMPFPTDDLAGSMLIGEASFVDEIYLHLRETVDAKTLPPPSETL